jgi:hypothetical protein
MVLGTLMAGWSAANALSGGRLNKFAMKQGSRLLGKGLKMAGRAFGLSKDTTDSVAQHVGNMTGNKSIEKGMTSKKKKAENKAANPSYYKDPMHRNTNSNFIAGKDVAPKISSIESNSAILR